MNCKECKIVCEGKEVATISCTKEGINIKCTEDVKQLFKGCCFK